MTEFSRTEAESGMDHHPVEVADETLTFRPVYVDDPTPTGAQLAAAAGFKPNQNATVLQLMSTGELEDVRPTETVDLRRDGRRFIIVVTDRDYLFTIDGQRFTWPGRIISGAIIRKLGQIPADMDIYHEQVGEADYLVGDEDLIDLDKPGVESFISHKITWVLNVQGVKLEVEKPTIVVREAMILAGFDPQQGWHIFLKVLGQPKKEVGVEDMVDLRTPGIEKIRLTPKEVNNGEAPWAPRREFALLDVDEAYLDKLGFRWETVVDNNRRWLLIHEYQIPDGYTQDRTLLALDIPLTYPGAQIDMFYANPPILLKSGRAIDCANIAATILNVPFNGWSRHRGPGSAWNPSSDNVITHLALVESALTKEIGE